MGIESSRDRNGTNMKPALKKLVVAYDRLQRMTARLCLAYCEPPHKCCTAACCDDALKLASDMGETIPPGDGDPRFPLIVDGVGCTAAAHLRPMCSMFLCPEARGKLTTIEARAFESAKRFARVAGRDANAKGLYPLWFYNALRLVSTDDGATMFAKALEARVQKLRRAAG